jgi:hypothetical protein
MSIQFENLRTAFITLIALAPLAACGFGEKNIGDESSDSDSGMVDELVCADITDPGECNSASNDEIYCSWDMIGRAVRIGDVCEVTSLVEFLAWLSGCLVPSCGGLHCTGEPLTPAIGVGRGSGTPTTCPWAALRPNSSASRSSASSSLISGAEPRLGLIAKLIAWPADETRPCDC